jgi:hypothetical protein
MGGAGGFNAFPLHFGGDPTPTEDVYRALRSNVGKGGSNPEPIGENFPVSIVELWRLCRARGIAAAASTDERAALQAFPHLATDLIPYYERLLLPDIDAGASEEERRSRVKTRWTEEAGGDTDSLTTRLQGLDSRFSLYAIDHAKTTTTIRGRAFEDLTASEPFNGGRKSTAFPNYSTDMRVTAVLDTGGGDLAPFDRRVMEDARQLLSSSLSAWVFFQVVVGEDGFDLDTDPLDFTMLIP